MAIDHPNDIDRLVAEALAVPADRDLLAAAGAQATSTRDRQVVAIAAAYLDRNHDLVDALARDHLVDHPDSVLVAEIAAANRRSRP
jgi:hypothetical protein